jgi:hypothetical protein
MSARRSSGIILFIVLALLVTASVHAQGPGPKGEPFVPAAPASSTPSRSPAFRQAAEAALQAYLEAHGPAAPLARRSWTERGVPSTSKNRPPSLPWMLTPPARPRCGKSATSATGGSRTTGGTPLRTTPSPSTTSAAKSSPTSSPSAGMERRLAT